MSLLSLKPPQERSTSKGKRIVPIVVKTSASEDRPRRGRISITAGEESEANVTCGFSQLSRQDVLEEGEHKRAVQIPHMFTLFEDARLQAGTERRNGLSLLSLLSLKPQQARTKQALTTDLGLNTFSNKQHHISSPAFHKKSPLSLHSLVLKKMKGRKIIVQKAEHAKKQQACVSHNKDARLLL